MNEKWKELEESDGCRIDAPSWNLPGGVRKPTKLLNQQSRCPVRDSNCVYQQVQVWKVNYKKTFGERVRAGEGDKGARKR